MNNNLRTVDVINSLVSNGYQLIEAVGGDQYYFKNNEIIVCYVTPHKDINFKHLIRAELITDFNKWSDATYEVFISKRHKIFDVLKHLDELTITQGVSGYYDEDEVL